MQFECFLSVCCSFRNFVVSWPRQLGNFASTTFCRRPLLAPAAFCPNN